MSWSSLLEPSKASQLITLSSPSILPATLAKLGPSKQMPALPPPPKTNICQSSGTSHPARAHCHVTKTPLMVLHTASDAERRTIRRALCVTAVAALQSLDTQCGTKRMCSIPQSHQQIPDPSPHSTGRPTLLQWQPSRLEVTCPVAACWALAWQIARLAMPHVPVVATCNHWGPREWHPVSLCLSARRPGIFKVWHSDSPAHTK